MILNDSDYLPIINNISNEKIELYKDNGRYYLRYDCDFEDNHSFYKCHIERIRFGFHLRSINKEIGYDIVPSCTIDLGLDEELPIEKDFRSNSYFTVTKIKDKVKEMTVEEIEKKLGCKVKIVAEHK